MTGSNPKRFNPYPQEPAFYLIRVQGILDQSWSERLGGLTIAIEPDADGRDRSVVRDASGDPPVTVLRGHVLDQAALSGLLNTLYDLGLPLLSLECLPDRRLADA
jgi:hypothetical protein